MSVLAYVGLGSNLGDRAENVRRAAAALAGLPGLAEVRCSSLYESAPWGYDAQPAFVNAVVEARSELSPRPLLAELREIERRFGRRRETEEVRWGPRVLDLDLLLYGALALDEPDLVVPHPRMHERRFVLAPLCELRPEAYHPRLGKTARELLRALAPDSQEVRRLEG